MLPAITSQDIEAALDLLKFLSISQIELQSLVAAQLSIFLPQTCTVLYLIVIRDFTLIIGNIPTCGCRDIETEVQVSTKSIKELELIVELSVTYETAYVTILILLVQHGNWVQSRHGVIGTVTHPLMINLLQWVVLNCSANGTLVSIRVVCEYTLTIKVDGQTVVQQSWSKVETNSCTVHACGLQCTIVVQETSTYTIRHLEVGILSNMSTSYACIDFLSECCTINLVLPVGVSIAKSCNSIGIFTIIGHEELAECVSTQYIDLLTNSLESTADINAYTWFSTCLTLLCGNQDNTVRCTATINSCGRSILKNREALDVVRVDCVQNITTRNLS